MQSEEGKDTNPTETMFKENQGFSDNQKAIAEVILVRHEVLSKQ